MSTELSFGEWLKHQRMGRGLTREQLALQIGCATITLRKFEAEERRPSEQIVERLAEIFNIPALEKAAFLEFSRGDWTKAPKTQPGKTPWHNSKTIPRTNLRAPLTSLIGRDREIAELLVYVSSPDTRLITLLGPPGIGKTRLSLAVAHASLPQFKDGVFFVDLAPLETPELMASTVAQSLGLVEKHDRSPVERLKTTIGDKRLLIVLDNVEHLLEAAAQLASDLLSTCSRLKILTTSREAIRSPGEWLYPVPALTIPTSAELISSDMEALSHFSALKLFVERGRAVRPDFQLNGDNVHAVTAICTQLDGLPLAIELIAARVRWNSAQTLLEQLSDHFVLSADGMRAVPMRQKTLLNAIGWSYNLLSEKEQTLVRRLTVFTGGWILEAAQAVCSGDTLISDEVSELLQKLANKSLINITSHTSASTPRYHMLEVIRQYGHEKLSETGDKEVIAQRHLDYFVKLVETSEPELYHSNQGHWLNRLDEELENLRTALEWSLAHDSGRGLHIAVIPWLFWEPRGHSRELSTWLAQCLKIYNQPDSLHARALVMYSQLVAQQGDLLRAREIAGLGLDMSRKIADPQAEAFSLWGLGAVTALQGDLGNAIPLVKQSLAIYETLGDKLGQATSKGWLWLNNADQARSKIHILESLELCRELGHLSGIALCLSELAHRTIWEGDFSSASQWLDEAYLIYRQLGDRSGEAEILYYYGNLSYWTGNYSQARIYFQDAIALLEKVGIYLYAFWPRVDLAYAILRQGDLSEARVIFEVCIRRFQSADNTIGVVYAVEGLASLRVIEKRYEQAAQLFAWAEVMRRKIEDLRPPVEQTSVENDLQVIRTNLTDTLFEKLSADGRVMTMAQAITMALGSSI